MGTIVFYEDTAGHIHISDGQTLWDLGPVTPGMRGQAGRDAESWLAGYWEPSEGNGHTPERMSTVLTGPGRDNITLIGAWRGGQLYLNTVPDGTLAATTAGLLYLGLDEKGRSTRDESRPAAGSRT